MYKRKNILLIVVCILFLVFPYHAGAEENFSPVTNSGKKWRIGYFQGSEYYEFRDQLKGTVDALMNIGWIKKVNMPDDADISARKLWLWLSKNIQSEYIEFIDDAFWSHNEKEKSCEVNKERIYERTVKEREIDLVIAMGTAAGECLSKAIQGYNVNTVVMCASNPILSEIVKKPAEYSKSPELSGIDHIHAKIERDKFYNEFDLFYRLVQFKKLGIVYQDTPYEKVYAAVDDAKRVAKEHNFELIEKKIPGGYHLEQHKKEVKKKYKELTGQDEVDAVYVTEHLEERKENIDLLKELLKPMLEQKVATWSQTPRAWMVKYGVVMGLDGADPADIGMFEAKVMAQILRGKKPGEISQLFVNPKNESITLNLEAAQKIQLDLSWEALVTADQVYEQICENIDDVACKDEE